MYILAFVTFRVQYVIHNALLFPFSTINPCSLICVFEKCGRQHFGVEWLFFTWLLWIRLWAYLRGSSSSEHNSAVWKRFIRQLGCLGALICITHSKQMVSLCGGVLVPEYLETWFNISIWLPACNNVTLIDWIYSELLTQLKTMCAVQLNRSWNQIEGLWHPLLSCGSVFCHSI